MPCARAEKDQRHQEPADRQPHAAVLAAKLAQAEDADAGHHETDEADRHHEQSEESNAASMPNKKLIGARIGTGR